MIPEVLQYGFMQRALLASLLVGLAAPAVGVFLVQRRLSLIGDGIGHVALTGVAVGLLTARSPVLTALVAAVAGALAIELIRARGRTSGDIALAVLFYGGIAGGVVVVGLAEGGSTATLNAYLFGAITTTTRQDLVAFAVLAVTVLAVALVLAGRLFAVSADEEYARASGLPVLALNVVLAVLTAVTVVVSMRVVGLLLISALMILPVAAAQLLRGSFRGTALLAVLIGVVVSVSGVSVSFYANTPSGGTIVLLAIGVFVIAAGVAGLGARWSRWRGREPASPHPAPLLWGGEVPDPDEGRT
ncbi:MAG TPA: metal ABC transporter permease [Jiangellales bacterium]|nr:metal ABC transporter permease [Jiangellales bacterium]